MVCPCHVPTSDGITGREHLWTVTMTGLHSIVGHDAYLQAVHGCVCMQDACHIAGMDVLLLGFQPFKE
jgi:hypothetical protein